MRAQIAARRALGGRVDCEELPAPCVDPCGCRGRERLQRPVVVEADHAGLGDEEVIDAVVRSCVGQRNRGRFAAGPAAGRERIECEHCPPGADQAVAHGDPQSQLRRDRAGVEDIQPQRDLAELGGLRVEVDAVAVVDREVVLHPLALVGVLLGGDRAAELGLLALEVGVGELIDGLVEEGARAHRRLADRPLQDVVGAGAGQALGEAVAGEAAGQDLGRIVGAAPLAVAAGQAIEELAGRVDADDLVRRIGRDLRMADEPGAGVVVVAVGGGPHLVQVLAGEAAGEAEQALVDGAELVDAELGVGDPSAPLLALRTRVGQSPQDRL
ncbi:hypothetical protein OV079_29985 [Nannocystis pusilla]|uniref:Uncharacterized protein n=1 Tax=Nannocystis pusilla TaxID=889268 RepID=A0A9X3ETI8_9BACT|nr:hypothetical protein [Nannocystis pusilla]MCY1009721.1 hypothetical protein [Nannocystis pusilla]